MKYVCAVILCLCMWVNMAWAVQTHKISPEERQSLPWWGKERPVREAAVVDLWWDKNRIVRPPSPIEAERSEKYANNRGRQKTSDNVRLSIKLDKMED